MNRTIFLTLVLLGTIGCEGAIKDTGDSSFPDADADTDTDTDSDTDADTDTDTDPDAEIDFFYFEWDGAFQGGEPSSAYIVDETGEVIDLTHRFSAIFIDSAEHDGSASGPYICTVLADVTDEMETFSPAGWDGYPGMAFEFDPTEVTWTTSGGACEEAAFTVGVSSVEDLMMSLTLGFGYGPMDPSSDLYSDLITYVDATEWSDDWAGKVGTGSLYTDITGDAELIESNYTFVYEVAADGLIDTDAEPIDGAGTSASPIDGYYAARGFYGFGWAR